MSAYFETLSELGSYFENTGIEVVDPGTPLVEWADYLHKGNSWKNQPSIRKVVSFIARAIASTPVHLYERRGDQDRVRVRDGDLAKLLKRPSRAPAMTPYRFWESMLIDGLLHDKWCARIVEHPDGPELIRIPARLVKFKSDFLGRIVAVKVTNNEGQTVEFDPDEFLIDVGYSERGANGTSPLVTLKDLLDEYREAVEYRRSIWKNGARSPLVLERDKEWSEGAFDRFQRTWAAFRKGGGNEGGTPILEDGMKANKLDSFRPKDTLDLEGRKLTDIEVASAYHIAPELIGAREGTFANMQAFKQMLYGPSLGPYFESWQQALNASLVHRFDAGRDVYIEANIEAKLRGSFEEQAEVISTAVGAPWMLRNEARAKHNMPAIEGGDELVTPLNVLIGGQSSPQDGKAVESVLVKFRDRQRQVVASKRESGSEWWDRARWDRELVADLSKAGVEVLRAAAIAREVNDAAEAEYLKGAGDDHHADEDD